MLRLKDFDEPFETVALDKYFTSRFIGKIDSLTQSKQINLQLKRVRSLVWPFKM